MADHTESARIAREAAFASTIPNWKVTIKGKPARPCEKMPAILYADPVDHVDHLGRRVPARYVVDITPVIDDKEKMLALDDLDGLIDLVQASVIEIHAWGSTVASNGASRAITIMMARMTPPTIAIGCLRNASRKRCQVGETDFVGMAGAVSVVVCTNFKA